ncbi:MAG: tetratricopeptide repeat protein [Phycisphaerae bacterium]
MPESKSKHSYRTFAWALLAGILGFYFVAAARFPLVYIWATYEDLFGEWVQVWSLVVALVVSARLAMTRWRFRWFFALLAASCFYVSMEEISWGQRLIGFSSPHYFRANNLQGETNLHNFFAGPHRTSLKAAVTWFVVAVVAGYGLAYPLALRLRLRAATWIEARGLAAPPLYLWPFFCAGAFLEKGPFHFNEAEVAEILIGMALAMTAVQYHFAHRRQLEVHRPADWPQGAGRGLAFRLGGMSALVLGLAVATTLAVYSSPTRRTRIDNRIANGVEKFASRYARHDQWEMAADLYRRVYTAEPDRVSIMRRLAECYWSMGDDVRGDAFINQALTTDLRRDKAKPGKASIQRSLARTYRMMNDDAKADRHLRKALKLSLKRIKRHPDSAGAAYSLGSTYALLDRPKDALEHYSQAYQLKPTSKKYRKAYYSALNRVR